MSTQHHMLDGEPTVELSLGREEKHPAIRGFGLMICKSSVA
jgi:hypothetical protein